MSAVKKQGMNIVRTILDFLHDLDGLQAPEGVIRGNSRNSRLIPVCSVASSGPFSILRFIRIPFWFPESV